MNHTLGLMLASGLLLLCCRGTSMAVAFLAFTAGLEPQHVAAHPLLEQVSCPTPDTCAAMRVYPDGALYHQDVRDPAAPAWSYLTQVRPAGIAALTELFDGLCRVSAAPERNANDMGSLVFRWETPRCAREVLITGVSYGEYAALQQVSAQINRNLVPRTSAAPARSP